MDAINASSFSTLSTHWALNTATPSTPQTPSINPAKHLPIERNLALGAEALDGSIIRNELPTAGLDLLFLGPIKICMACTEFVVGYIQQNRTKQRDACAKIFSTSASFVLTIERYSAFITNFSLLAYTVNNLIIISGSIYCILEGVLQGFSLAKQVNFHKTLTFRSFYNLDTSDSADMGMLRKKIRELELLVKTHSKEFQKVFEPTVLDELNLAIESLKRLTNQNSPLIPETSEQYVKLAYKIKKEVVSRDLSHLLKEHIRSLPTNAEETLMSNRVALATAETAFAQAQEAPRAAVGADNAEEFNAVKEAEKTLIKAKAELKSTERKNAQALRHLAGRVEPWLAIEIAHRCSAIDVRKNPSTPEADSYHIDSLGNLVLYDIKKERYTRIDDKIRHEAAGELLQQTDGSYKDVLERPVIQTDGELEESAKGSYAKDAAGKIVKLSLVDRLDLTYSEETLTGLPQEAFIYDKAIKDAVDEAADLMSQVFTKSKQKILIYSLALTCIALTALSLLVATFFFPPTVLVVMSVSSSVVGFARALICQGMLKQRNWTFQLGKGGYFAYWICDLIGAIGKNVLRIDKNGTLAQQNFNFDSAIA